MRQRSLYTLALLFATLQTFAQTYTYDNLNRLTKVVYDNGTTITYSYDVLGNRLSKKVTGATPPKEAYAVLDNGTLTFYYDDSKSSREGTAFELNTDDQSPDWDNNSNDITKVFFNPSFANARPTTTFRWFYQMNNLTTIEGIEYLNTSNVTNMGFMFCGCRSLINLDVSGFSTSHVEDMFSMFRDCTSLINLDVSSFDTSNVTDMYKMFFNLKIESLDVSNFDISKCEDTGYMFYYCSNLDSLCISYSMENLDETACDEIGQWKPCTLIAPKDFDFGVDTSGEQFVWKSGTFKLGNPIEAYAWLSSDGKTLTFCYDNIRDEREGETYELNTGSANPEWNFDPWNSPLEVTSVVFNSSFANIRPTSTYSWFHNFKNLKEIIGINYLNTSNVTHMYSMFRDCSSLGSIDVSHFDTSNVIMLWGMFDGCSNLTSLDVSNFDLSKVTDLTLMFAFCSNLKSLNVSNLNTSNITSMYMLFEGCLKLNSLDVGNFDTSNVTNMSYMFDNCKELTSLDLSNFDTSQLKGSTQMLCNCSSLTKLNISSTMSNIDEAACSGVGSSSKPCKITAPDGFDFGVDTSDSYFKWKSGYFKLSGAKEAYAWLSSDEKTLTFCYDNIRDEREGKSYDLNSYEYSSPDWFPGWDENSSVSTIVFEPSFADARPPQTSYWFVNMVDLKEISGIEYLNTSNVKSMYNMFHGCSGLETLDLTHFDTSNVTDMGQMFDGCTSLKSLDLSHFNTPNVISMGFMFRGCSNLERISFGSINTSNVIQTHYMFNGCHSLKSLDLGHFDFSNVTSSSWMFSDCSSLEKLRIPSALDNLEERVFNGIGSPSSPCAIFAPTGFDFGVDTSGSYFYWRGGYFTIPAIPTEIDTVTDSSTSGNLDVYSTNGTQLYHHATPEQLNRLPKGVYIVNGKKVVIK